MMGDVSRETTERLAIFAALLRKWNGTINLVSPKTLSDLEARHLADSKQLAELIDPLGLWVDMGSGGGLPGLVLAIFWEHSSVAVTLVESDVRKATFLRTVVREAGLSRVTIINDRIENVPPLNADHISARALAPLADLLPYTVRHLKPEGVAWLMKGRRWQSELADVRASWKFRCQAHQSITDKDAAILKLTGIMRD